MYVVVDECKKAVLECLLDGMSMGAISNHMGLSRRHVYNLRDDVVDRIAQNAHFAEKLQIIGVVVKLEGRTARQSYLAEESC